MKVAIYLVALAGAASASLSARQNIPTCAITCIANANLGGCGSTDNACLCKNQAFISSTTTCIESSCQGADLQAAISAAEALCAAAGVTLTPPASSSAPAASSTGTHASTGSSIPKSSASSTAPAGSQTSPAASTPSKSAAKTNSVNALGGLAALGLAALAL